MGYSYYSNGTYTLRGEEFVTKVTEILLLKDEDWPTRYTESLEVQELPAEAPESKGTLKRLDGGAKISLVYKCGPLENCIGEQIYDRVD